MKNAGQCLAWVVSLSILVSFSLVAKAGSLTFTPGNIYTTQSFGSDVDQYTATGNLVTTTSITGLRDGEETKGLGFGPDGNLYVVLDRLFEGARLASIGPDGNVWASYELPGSTGGNLSYGKISFGANETAYIGTGSGVVQVKLGDLTSAHLLNLSTPLNTFDMSLLPNGDLLVLSGNDLEEFDTNGQLTRNVVLSDPNHVSDASFFFVNDLRGENTMRHTTAFSCRYWIIRTICFSRRWPSILPPAYWRILALSPMVTTCF